MAEQNTRTERDSMGEMQVPADALYGASTARAVANFPIAQRGLPGGIIHAFGHLKAACAEANRDLEKLDPKVAAAIIDAADRVAAGQYDDHFPVDVYQTGSGTSTNMNANEVIANLATQSLGSPVHPNDHVNMGQSSNDTFPTAMHIAAATALGEQLIPALKRLHEQLHEQAGEWDRIIKIGRTHLMDATPIRIGQVFAGYAEQAKEATRRATVARDALAEALAIGGTAVGTGINTHPEFAGKVCRTLEHRTGLAFREAANHPEAQASKDRFVHAAGSLKTIAVSLSKIANDIRHLGSGPRCGLGELMLPAIQPGSSIMPGKVNPVLCESVMQVACRVIGNDSTITTAGLGGVGSIFELNVAMPVMADAFDESVRLLANAANAFVDKLLIGLEVNEARCTELIEQSLAMCTSLAPVIGYDNAARIAKQAAADGSTVREVAQAMIDKGDLDLTRDQLSDLLDPAAMTEPTA